MKLEVSVQIFEEYFIIKFHENPSTGSRVVSCERTDRRIDRQMLYYVCINILTLNARLPARSQYPEGPATGHLNTGFSWFPCVYKRMLRWFPSFQVATTCFSCSPPD